mmetsp:Transcript_4974/g.14547  ORF Transcript_4974/g.14547 Transcript_4974/m.14547 type:complete len:211 (+) Transcript_4974:598-1230(+)
MVLLGQRHQFLEVPLLDADLRLQPRRQTLRRALENVKRGLVGLHRIRLLLPALAAKLSLRDELAAALCALSGEEGLRSAPPFAGSLQDLNGVGILPRARRRERVRPAGHCVRALGKAPPAGLVQYPREEAGQREVQGVGDAEEEVLEVLHGDPRRSRDAILLLLPHDRVEGVLHAVGDAAVALGGLLGHGAERVEHVRRVADELVQVHAP